MSHFKLGIVLETTGLPIRQALAAASKLGAAGVQVNAVSDLAPDNMTATARREFRNLLRTHNLELSALNCPLRRGLDVAENLQPRIEYIRKAMQLAFDLGPRIVIAPLPKLTDSPIAREALTDLGSFGDRSGSVLALEAGLDPGDKVRDYLNSFDTGSLMVNFDPANFLMNGFDPLASLAALAGKIADTRARDARMAAVSGGAREVPVGAGDIEWMVYIATLESIGYRGYLTVDRESGDDKFADVTAGVRFLRRFVPQSAS